MSIYQEGRVHYIDFSLDHPKISKAYAVTPDSRAQAQEELGCAEGNLLLKIALRHTKTPRQ